MTTHEDVFHYHGFLGSGGGALGFNRGHARVGNTEARFVCIGGFDVDPAACRDFKRLVGVEPTCMDMFSRDQYIAFHGKNPPSDWREATVEDIRRSAGYKVPNIVFLSAPCKGFSGLLPEKLSKSLKYQALNQLAERALWLMLEGWADNPPELFIFENVPRIATRGRALLDRITALLHAYGYVVAETMHDCGEIGNLAQSRKRFLMVARHVAKVPAFLYQPEKRPLRAVGEILGRMPLPGDLRAGPMHAIPRLQWKTWVRLAFVEAGSDWRSLNKLNVKGGYLSDYLIVPEMRRGDLGVVDWSEHAGTIIGNAKSNNGNFSVADVRYDGVDYGQYGVVPWDKPTGTVTSQRSPGQGGFAVQDVRCTKEYHHNVFRIVRWDQWRGAITSGDCPSNNGGGVADPRPPEVKGGCFGKYAVAPWDAPTGTVIGGDDSGAYAVADPSINRSHDRYRTAGLYGVAPWEKPCGSVTAQGQYDNGPWSIADPRVELKRPDSYGVLRWDRPSGAVAGAGKYDNGRWSIQDPRLPSAADKLVCVIRALDGTWHRPFTTLELAALQSLVDPEDTWGETPFDLDGNSDSAKRERIGNAVPPGAAEAIAGVMGEAILLARTGERFQLSSKSIWVRPVAVALAVKQ
ncbi:MAG TPA: DNA cytosine methyltransferase [Candidatus Angelobacter sp.]|nr:DNA cytosine methyltransferase [Candidatus Angelobacter sp.]